MKMNMILIKCELPLFITFHSITFFFYLDEKNGPLFAVYAPVQTQIELVTS
jgi:hypothetical protein